MVAGHLQEKKGYFYMVLNYTVGGKRKTKWIPTGMVVKGNKKKAEALLWETRQTYVPEVEEEAVELSGEIMFVDFLAMWLEIAKSTIKLTTYASYAEMTNKIIIPYFKPLKRRLTEVTAADIPKFYLVQLERVSANSVIHYHAIIHRAMKYAVKTDLIVSNPVDKVDRPKKNEFQGSFYTEDEIQDLFEVARGTKLELPIVLAAFYGLRRSEVLGIKWSAIDFIEKTISIKHKVLSEDDGPQGYDVMKTKSSFRTMPLLPFIEEELRKEKARQAELKRVMGRAYIDEYDDYVCTDALGRLYDPDFVTNHFKVILKRNKLRDIRFHELRHSCASLLLAKGIPMKMIQDWLGHSDMATTANIYSHIDSTSKKETAQTIGELLG